MGDLPMTDTCEKCGRPKTFSPINMDRKRCTEPTDWLCDDLHAARLRGLREGVELAKDCAVPEVRRIDEAIIDWSDVDAELARREEG